MYIIKGSDRLGEKVEERRKRERGDSRFDCVEDRVVVELKTRGDTVCRLDSQSEIDEAETKLQKGFVSYVSLYPYLLCTTISTHCERKREGCERTMS